MLATVHVGPPHPLILSTSTSEEFALLKGCRPAWVSSRRLPPCHASISLRKGLTNSLVPVSSQVLKNAHLPGEGSDGVLPVGVQPLRAEDVGEPVFQTLQSLLRRFYVSRSGHSRSISAPAPLSQAYAADFVLLPSGSAPTCDGRGFVVRQCTDGGPGLGVPLDTSSKWR